jgi:hypothetical protein
VDCKRRLYIKGASHPDRIKEIGGRALISNLREEHVRGIRSRFLPAIFTADEAVEAEARPKPNAALALLHCSTQGNGPVMSPP